MRRLIRLKIKTSEKADRQMLAIAALVVSAMTGNAESQAAIGCPIDPQETLDEAERQIMTEVRLSSGDGELIADKVALMDESVYNAAFGAGNAGDGVSESVRRKMGVSFDRNGRALFDAIESTKREIREKIGLGQKLAEAERRLLEPTLEFKDLAQIVDGLGPRELALLSHETNLAFRAAKTASTSAKRAKIASNYLEKVSRVAIACSRGAGCANEFRTVFQKITAPLTSIRQAVSQMLAKATGRELVGGRDLETWFRRFEQEAKNYAKRKNIPEAQAYDEYGALLESDLTRRMGKNPKLESDALEAFKLRQKQEYDARIAAHANAKGISRAEAERRIGALLKSEQKIELKRAQSYPSLAELMAAMAYRSPSLRNNLFKAAHDGKTVRWAWRWKFLAGLSNKARTAPQRIRKRWLDIKIEECSLDPACDPEELGELIAKRADHEAERGESITHGQRLLAKLGEWVVPFDINRVIKPHRVIMPKPRTLTKDHFKDLMVELDDVLLKMNYPDEFWGHWARAFPTAAMVDKNWNVMKVFAARLDNDYRQFYHSMLDGTLTEVYGKPRPEVLEEFTRWGITESITRRLIAVIKDRKLGSAFAKDRYFQEEVRRLALETMFVMKPVISGLINYSAIDQLNEWRERRRKAEARLEEIRKNPTKHIRQHPAIMKQGRSSLDRKIISFEAQLVGLERELKDRPHPDDVPAIEHDIKAVKEVLERLKSLKERDRENTRTLDPSSSRR